MTAPHESPLFDFPARAAGRVRVKVCGLTRLEDARVALEAGADFLGFVFYKKSPRYIEPERVAEILRALREESGAARVAAIGVFVDAPPEETRAIALGLGLAAAQLHGREDAGYLRALGPGICAIKAARMRGPEDLEPLAALEPLCAATLLDAFAPGAAGGTGQRFNHGWARLWLDRARRPVFIAGGLAPENAGEVARALRPFALDVSSGVEESPGVHDPRNIRAFLQAVRGAGENL